MLDEHPLRLRRTEGLTGVEPVTDVEMDGVPTYFGTGKVELPQVIQMLDQGTKLDINDHVREPGPKEAAKLDPFGSGYSFLQDGAQPARFSE